MAENRFIGNRYVPYHDGVWDAAKQYDYLTAVLYDGNAYVSRKPVPEGTLPTDNAYWAFWGSGNAVLDSLSLRLTALETRVGNMESRVDKNEADILELYRRMGLVEQNVDALFAEQGAQSIIIGQLQQAITALQNDITRIDAALDLKENTANKNALGGYMGLDTFGYGQRPNIRTAPLIMTANITSAQTVTAGTQLVQFNNILHSTTVNGTQFFIQTSGSTAGNIYLVGGGGIAYYDVWLSAAVLCVPTGNTGIKDIYAHWNNEARYSTEAYTPTSAARISIQIPEVYIGPMRPGGTDQIGIYTANWSSGDLIGQGSIANDNYGSTWISLKAYARSLPVG